MSRRHRLLEPHPWNPAFWSTCKSIQNAPLVVVQDRQISDDLAGIPNSISLPIALSDTREGSLSRGDVGVSRLLLKTSVLTLPAPKAHFQLVNPVSLDADLSHESIPLIRITGGRRRSFSRRVTGAHVAVLGCRGYLIPNPRK